MYQTKLVGVEPFVLPEYAADNLVELHFWIIAAFSKFQKYKNSEWPKGLDGARYGKTAKAWKTTQVATDISLSRKAVNSCIKNPSVSKEHSGHCDDFFSSLNSNVIGDLLVSLISIFLGFFGKLHENVERQFREKRVVKFARVYPAQRDWIVGNLSSHCKNGVMGFLFGSRRTDLFQCQEYRTNVCRLR